MSEAGTNPPKIPGTDLSRFRFGAHLSDGAVGLLGRLLQMQARDQAALQTLTREWVYGGTGTDTADRMEELVFGGYVIYVGSDHIDKFFVSSVPFSWNDLEHQWMWNVDGPEENFSAVWRSRSLKQHDMFSGQRGYFDKAGTHVYVIENKEHASVKIGISKAGSLVGRLKAHAAQGWDLVGSTRPLAFGLAHVTEAHALKHFRECLGTRPSMAREQMPQGGWTETISAKNVSPVTAWLGVLGMVQQLR